ncbi:2,5-diamino-6-ribosylamino-4(3H)-pyrimidinone 5'-phosphate reductase [archaeon BMS3Abin16]|nr:2,5-diamino-6-ribosylamino-4(3H)-pyrimidinone 5'-phosphate reductase [archaeon BMS3Abin16]HDY74259.1 2,5-diamino-6-(ribosylamino)-4(3H)-pyrimidinone 5'-phosphate reductase [Euryarchaeota archaeon]
MRPHVILNAGVTADGKIATRTGDSAISSKEDLERVHRIRESVDAIMVGIGTVLLDDPRLSIHKIDSHAENPIRVVADSRARIPLSARMFNEKGTTIIAVSAKADKERVRKIEKRAEVYVCGAEKVDLKCLMRKLYRRGVQTLLLEGGGNLNYSMLRSGLVDEVRFAIAPRLVGGRDAVSLVEGEGFPTVAEGVELELLKHYSLGRDLILEYRVVRKGD